MSWLTLEMGLFTYSVHRTCIQLIMHLSTSTVCNYLNATPSNATSRGSCFRVEHLLLCGIPNLETIRQKQMDSVSKPLNQQTSGIKSSSTKCFQQTRICFSQMLTASQPNSLKYSIRLW
jgi:hypothetical protein